MVNRWFGVGQFLSGAMGQLYPGGDISGWLSKKKDKLPLVKAYIDSEVESLEEFQIRKIK
jgi:hypothetical protein